jgi:hypothetical protein
MPTSSATLVPALTSLDERVHAALPVGAVGATVQEVAEDLFGVTRWRCDKCENTWWRHPRATGPRPCYEPGCYGWGKPVTTVKPDEMRTVREILNGLERVERAHNLDGKWRIGPPAVRTPTARRR